MKESKLLVLRNASFRTFLSFFILLISLFNADAQKKTVTGKVVDALNQPITGVSVTVKNQNTGTTTDDRGYYTISASPDDILVFSSVGYGSFEKKVGNETTVNVGLTNAATSMNEVVVIGYGTTARKNLTTAVAKIDPKSVPQAANNSVTQLMFGRAAGVQAVQQSAEPGGNINVSIRGRGNPLIVVDGVIVPFGGLEPSSGNIYMNGGVNRGGLAGLNPDDIESIEFLKDASASIYGVNAANGVVLITTKKGKSGRVNVSYDGSYSVVKNQKYFEPLTASEYMTYYNQLTQDKFLLDSTMAPYGSKPANLANYPNVWHPFTATQIQNAGVGTRWLDYVLRDGNITNHVINVNGGTDKLTYYFSGGYFNQQGTIKHSNLEKWTGRMNMTFNLTKFLSFTANVNYARNKYQNSQAGSQSNGIGQQGFGALQSALAYPSYLPVFDTLTKKYTIFKVSGNPISLLNIADETNTTNLFANFSADFKIIPGVLTGRLLYGNNSENSDRNYFLPSTVYFNQLYRARGSVSTAKRENQTLEATVNLKKKIKDIVNIDAVAGVGQYPSTYYTFMATGSDMLDAIGTDNLGSSSLSSQTISSQRSASKFRSYFTRESFDFLDRYVLGFSFRYDGYNQFFPQNKYASFPAGSIAWKISNEKFMQKITAINMLKLRGSIGVTGNASGVAYGAFSPEYNVITFNNGAVAYVPYYLTALDNPNLKWPKTVNKNIGLDFSVLKDRISGSFDWFRDDITRLVIYQTTSQLSLIPTAPINTGHQVRTGWEAAVNTLNMKSGDFQWNSMINVSHVLYRWEERYANTFLRGYQGVKDPVNSIYVYQTSGILQVGQTAPSYQPTKARVPGSPIFVDVNDDKKLDSSDVAKVNGSPKYTIGFGNTFRYKNFDLMVMFYGQFGGHAYNANAVWADPVNFLGGSQSGIKQIADIWSTSNPNGTRPGIAYNEGALALDAGTDIGLEKTDFVRCRNITLGYTFNSHSLSKYVRSLRLYADVQNPFIITNYKIADPELQAAFVKGGPAPYPMATTYSLGVKANF
jgi:TonB-dependent starch-binding outer membrane protein SusC